MSLNTTIKYTHLPALMLSSVHNTGNVIRVTSNGIYTHPHIRRFCILENYQLLLKALLTYYLLIDFFTYLLFITNILIFDEQIFNDFKFYKINYVTVLI